jgi:oxygen-dependent protoporphyrinogen oxidase
VVGGGLAGLTAAYEATRRGLSVCVLEAASRPGGVASTERVDGWVIDGGPDSLLVQKPAAVALCHDLGIGDRLVPTLTPRTAYVLRDGRLHPLVEGSFLGFPVRARALARSSLFSLAGKLRMACELFVPRSHGDEDESIASFVRRRFGSEAAACLADPLLAGIHAGDSERLSIRALFPRLVDVERLSGSVLRGFRSVSVEPTSQGAFVSLPGGMGELVDALAGALAPGTVRVGSRVREIRKTGAYHLESDSGPVSARTVILAVPAYVAGTLLHAFDTTLGTLCEAIPYASTATVALGYRRSQIAHPMQGSGFVVPKSEHMALLAGTWVTSKWPGRAPAGHALLRGFLGGGRDPHRLERSDEELVASARSELTQVLGIKGEPVLTRLHRWPRQSPQYEVGHLARLRLIEERVAALPGVFLTGSGFRAIGIPDCIADGRAMAARAAGFLGDRT